MPKLHIARSEFLDPIMTMVPGVHWVKPYAAAKLLGRDVEYINRLCNEWAIPHINIPYDRLILVDHRSENWGAGGKFYLRENTQFAIFKSWTGRFTCPPTK